MSKQLYEALVKTAAEIAAANKELGFYAERKVKAVSATSPLKVLVQVGEDLQLMASKLTK